MKPPYYQGTLSADLTDKYLIAEPDDGFRGVAECRGGEFEDDTNTANVIRIRDTWNACQGLDLPENVEPGVLAELVGAARELTSRYELHGYGVQPQIEALESVLDQIGTTD